MSAITRLQEIIFLIRIRLISASATLGAWIQVDEMLEDAIVPRNINCNTRYVNSHSGITDN